MEDQTRDKVRALVREVLAKSLPSAEPGPEQASRFVQVAPGENNATDQVTRDESSKSVITEDDVRGLESGASLRIGEDARLTPLAADIIKEKRIEIVRRSSRRGSNPPARGCHWQTLKSGTAQVPLMQKRNSAHSPWPTVHAAPACFGAMHVP